VHAGLVHALGAAPDWGVVFTSWFGVVLVSGLFSAIGLVASAMCGTPALAAFVAMLVNVVVVFLPFLGRALSGLPARVLGWVVERIDVMAHFQNSFRTGAIDSSHVVFFLAWILALLFLAVRLVETRRWL
jgi:hypothetical protein